MASNEGEAGDLYVVVHVKPDQQFMREGDDLWYIAAITFPQAALGADLTVPTLEGPTTVKIRAGTQPGEVLTLRGKGMPRFRSYGKGDLHVRIGVSVPERLTSEQRALVEQLAREFNTDVQKGINSVFSRLNLGSQCPAIPKKKGEGLLLLSVPKYYGNGEHKEKQRHKC